MYFSETCVRSKPPQPNFVGSGPLDLHRISACSTVTLVNSGLHWNGWTYHQTVLTYAISFQISHVSNVLGEFRGNRLHQLHLSPMCGDMFRKMYKNRHIFNEMSTGNIIISQWPSVTFKSYFTSATETRGMPTTHSYSYIPESATSSAQLSYKYYSILSYPNWQQMTSNMQSISSDMMYCLRSFAVA